MSSKFAYSVSESWISKFQYTCAFQEGAEVHVYSSPFHQQMQQCSHPIDMKKTSFDDTLDELPLRTKGKFFKLFFCDQS